MIISASRRTDIPAFHVSWFMERLRCGQVTVKNPFNPRQEKVVSFGPESVDAIVFWTRNAAPILKHLPELDDRGYRYIFLYTITGYGLPLESRCPSVEQAVETFTRLSEKIGPQRVIWRFDPIIFIEQKGAHWTIERFNEIARSLKGSTDRVIISFLDLYRKVVRRLEKLKNEKHFTVVDGARQPQFVSRTAAALSALAAKNDMTIYSCAENIDLNPFGINPGSCIDAAYLNEIFNLSLSPAKDKSQRPHCNCAASQDIGTYNTCAHGCVYFYAIG